VVVFDHLRSRRTRDEITEVVERLRPDALVIDAMMEAAYDAAARSGLPTAVLCHFLASLFCGSWAEMVMGRPAAELLAGVDRVLALTRREFDDEGAHASVSYVGPVTLPDVDSSPCALAAAGLEALVETGDPGSWPVSAPRSRTSARSCQPSSAARRASGEGVAHPRRSRGSGRGPSSGTGARPRFRRPRGRPPARRPRRVARRAERHLDCPGAWRTARVHAPGPRSGLQRGPRRRHRRRCCHGGGRGRGGGPDGARRPVSTPRAPVPSATRAPARRPRVTSRSLPGRNPAEVASLDPVWRANALGPARVGA